MNSNSSTVLLLGMLSASSLLVTLGFASSAEPAAGGAYINLLRSST